MKRKTLLVLLVLLVLTVLSTAAAFAGELEDGNYYIKQGSKSLNIDIEYLSEAKNNTKINMIASNDSDWQRFKLLQQADGSYKILLAKRTNLSLNVKALETDTEVISYKDAKSYTEYYLIEETERTGYYTIRMKNSPTLAITATGGKGLTLREFTGAENQQFYFHAEGTVCPDLGAATEPTTEPETVTPTEPETPKTESVTEKKTYNIKLDVPKLSTQDKRWKNYKYSGSAKIGKYGCLLVSCTAALSYMDDEDYRPDKLSAKFKFSDGSMQWGYKWGKSRFKSGVKYSLTTVRKQLEAGKPVLIHGYSKKNGHHWAVITGVQGDGTKRSHYTVMDPSYSKVKTLDQFLKNFPDKKKLVTIKK